MRAIVDTSWTARSLAIVAMALLFPPTSKAQDVAVSTTTPPVDQPNTFETGLVEAQLGAGALLRLPFDQPFTLLFSMKALDFGGTEPTLRFKDFARQLDRVPEGVCENGRVAPFAGLSETVEAGTTKTQARFLIPAIDPNRYFVFCFETTSRISADLNEGERVLLLEEISGALSNFATEIEQAEADQQAVLIRTALQKAVRSYAKREGLVGEVRLKRGFSTQEVLEEFLAERESIAQCDPETIDLLVQDIITLLPESNAKTLLQSRLDQIVSGGQRPNKSTCQTFYEDVIRQVQDTTFENASTQTTALARLNRPLNLIKAPQRVFATKAIEALQTKDSLILGTTLPGSSAARRYVSADTGLAFVPELDSTVPYQGVNIYLRPVNPPSVTPLGTGRKGLARRFSIMLGVTLTDDLVQQEMGTGGTPIKFVDDLTDAGSLLLGFGFRINPALRVGGGAIAYRQLDSLIDLRASSEISYYFSLSLDLDVRSLFTGGAAGLFNGGSPSTTNNSSNN